MTDIEQRVGAERPFRCGQKATVRPPEGLGHDDDLVDLHGGDLRHPPRRRRPYIASAVLRAAEPPKHDLGDALLLRRQLGEHFVAMAWKRCGKIPPIAS